MHTRIAKPSLHSYNADRLKIDNLLGEVFAIIVNDFLFHTTAAASVACLDSFLELLERHFGRTWGMDTVAEKTITASGTIMATGHKREPAS